MHDYIARGLHVRSPFALPFMPLAQATRSGPPPSSPPDVTIHLGTTPDSLAAYDAGGIMTAGPTWQATRNAFCELQAHRRDDVEVEPAPEAAAFRRMRTRTYRAVSSKLRDRIARLGAARPDFRSRLPRFFALEAFRLTGYRKVLFCDSDLLFQQPVTELFEAEDALLCCGDRAFLMGQRRDAATFAPLEDPALAGAVCALDRTFNGGFLLIDADLVEERHYAGLLALLAPETWRSTDTPHTQQFLQNRYFAGRQALIGSTYNYLLGAAAHVKAREGSPPPMPRCCISTCR